MDIRMFAGKTIFPHSETGRLLETGVFSFLLHIVLITLLIFNLKTGNPKGRFPVYRVTIQPSSLQNNPKHLFPQALPIPQPIPVKSQIEKEENRSKEQVKQSKPVEEPKPLPQHPVDDQTIHKPIPLPMAETSTFNTDPILETEEILPIPTSLPLDGKNTSTKSGTGGSSLSGSGEGEGFGGGSRWIGIGKGTGMERGVPGSGGSGKGTGMGKKGPGSGSGGSGPGVSSPGYVENPKPAYPFEARERGYEGEVLLKVEVLPNGRVGEVIVEKSSGYEVLDQSALATVKKWRFIPARKGKVAFACFVNIPVKFQLRDSSF
jgi:TonB family protein